MCAHFVNGLNPELNGLLREHKLESEATSLPELQHLAEHFERTTEQKKAAIKKVNSWPYDCNNLDPTSRGPFLLQVLPLLVEIAANTVIKRGIGRTAHFFFLFWLHHTAYGTLVPLPGIEPAPLALEAQSLNHWTAREV